MKTRFFFVGLILLLATALRFHRLGYQSYWNDEGNTLRLVERTAPEIISAAAADIHPPGYYLALHLWHAALGPSEFALRSFSAFAGIVLVALLYCLGRKWFGPRTALISAALGALNPFLIYYAQEARMYALLATLSAASFLLFAHLTSRPLTKNFAIPLAYCLITAAGLYTHYAFGFTLLAQNLWALSHSALTRQPQRLLTWVGLQASVLLLYLPWLPIAYRQLTTWPATRAFPAFNSALLEVARYLSLGRTIQLEETFLALSVVGGLLLVALARLILEKRPLALALQPWLWLLLPVTLTLTFGLLTEAFSKFLLVAVPPLCLLLGHALTLTLPRIPKHLRLLPSLALLVLALPFFSATATALNQLYFDPTYFRDDYRGIARYLAQLQRPGDAVITISPNQWEAFSYYHRPEQGAAPVFPLPHTRPLAVAETEATLADLTTRYDRLFVLYWGERQADPDQVVENWLNAHTFKAGDTWHGQVRLATYAAANPALTYTVASNAKFGDAITLLGYALKAETLTPGDILQLTLFWQTLQPLDTRYKVFVHLYEDINAPPVAQHDSEPGGGLAFTSSWQPGQTYADHQGLLIPPDLPPGSYRLFIGLYNPVDSMRLGVTLDPQALGDRLDLGLITVR